MRALTYFAVGIALLAALLSGAPIQAGVFPSFMFHSTAGGAAPTNTVAPTACASPQVGSSCAGGNGTWTGSPTFTYQWKSPGCTTNISGATSINYTPVSGDIGNTLCLAVTGTNGFGSATTNSNVTSAVIAATGSVAFTALHTYFMSPTGSGTTCSSGSPCASPNAHASVCGDVWIAATGTYSNQINITTQPTNCPSTTGGIDGTGGVYFTTVVCATSFACNLTTTISGTGGEAQFQIDQVNNWAVEGFVGSTGNGAGLNNGCFGSQVDASSTIIHHIAFINNQCNNSGLGFFTGGSSSVGGTDYFALIGNLTWNSNQRSDFPSASMVDVGPANSDTNAGTHVAFYGNFGVNNAVAVTSSAYSDLECIMFDTFDAKQYVGTGVIKNNVCYNSSWVAIQIFMQTEGSSNPDIEIAQNSTYGDLACVPTAMTTAGGGELNLQLNGGYPWTINTYNNIFMATRQQVGCSPVSGGFTTVVYGMLTGGGSASPGSTVVNTGGSGKQNFIFNTNPQTSCAGSSCDAGFNTVAFNSFPIGTNTYSNPNYKNTTDLLSNHLTQPNCSGFTNIAACMGWNYGSQTATSLSIIDDLTPTASGTSGKGAQQAGACAADTFWPVWLKGVVYLQWDGTNLTENAGLVQKPCSV
jgi:hypothetical protein